MSNAIRVWLQTSLLATFLLLSNSQLSMKTAFDITVEFRSVLIQSFPFQVPLKDCFGKLFDDDR